MIKRDQFFEYSSGDIGEIENEFVNAFMRYQKLFMEKATDEEKSEIVPEIFFNFLYRQTLELVANSLYSGQALLIDHPANYQGIAQLDLPTRRQLLTFYNKTFKENIKAITTDYQNLGKAMEPIPEIDGIYQTHITEDIKNYLNQAAKIFEKITDDILQSYSEYVDKVAADDSDAVSEIIRLGLEKKQKLGEEYITTFTKDYCMDNDINTILEKYELIMNYSIFTAGEFDKDLFTRVIKDRLMNLGLDKYAVQENYLLEFAKNDSDLKANIIRMIETARLGKQDVIEDLVNQLMGL